MVKHPPLTFEYSQITPYVYLGTNLCCQPHFARSLLRKGVVADISLEEESVDRPFGAKYYLWLPTPDHLAPSQRQLAIGVQFMRELAKRRISCYVHCKRGHGRSPVLVAAYLVSNGMKSEEAVEHIRKRRMSIHPNRKQLAALRKFEKGRTSRA